MSGVDVLVAVPRRDLIIRFLCLGAAFNIALSGVVPIPWVALDKNDPSEPNDS